MRIKLNVIVAFTVSVLLFLASCGSSGDNESKISLSLNPNPSLADVEFAKIDTNDYFSNVNAAIPLENSGPQSVVEKQPLDKSSELIFDVIQLSDAHIMTDTELGNSQKTVVATFKRDESGTRYNVIDDPMDDFTHSLDISQVDFQNSSGTASFSGATFNVVISKHDTSTGNFGVLVHNSDAQSIDLYDAYGIVGGEPFIPFASLPNGEVTYTGDSARLASSIWSTGNLTWQFFGVFTMKVDFSAGTADLDIDFVRETSSRHRSSYYDGRDLTVDTSKGIFSGTLSWHQIFHNGSNPYHSPEVSHIYGSFHGNGGTSVTGTFYEKVDGNMAGYILGSRE